MIDDLTPSGIYGDLATNRDIKASIEIDCSLVVDDFAAKHGQTIRQHYAAGGYSKDFEEGWSSEASSMHRRAFNGSP
ncbi:hypothetical protein ACH50O_23435 (plasmid) [Methylomonas sp. 2BW1-5-20]|uniref:hypothetical protein n=1 Tax=Methylomonas sp. 2BW1-5-20 TaxID=3376686 RepID=UPI0040506013